MRYKVVPEPRSVAFLEAVQAALPFVPGTVEDCCRRIRDRTDLHSRDEAREYLTFAQALGLASESERGFSRTRADPDPDELGARFRERVFGAREVLETLDDPKSADEAFGELREIVPQWERDRRSDWESEWRERIEWLLSWGVEFGLVERTGAGYRRSTE